MRRVTKASRGAAMKDSCFGPSKDSIPDRRADDVELESLLRRTAEFFARRGSQLDERGPGIESVRDEG